MAAHGCQQERSLAVQSRSADGKGRAISGGTVVMYLPAL